MIVRQFLKFALPAAVLTSLTACSTPLAKISALRDTEAEYYNALKQPELLRYSTLELNEANKTLALANAAKTIAEMNSLAYIAMNQINTAYALSDAAQQQALYLELSKEKDLIVMDFISKRIRSARIAANKTNKTLELFNAKKTERGLVLTLGDMLFKTDKADLLPGAKNTISQLADFLLKHPKKTLVIEGYNELADNRNGNQQLSENRAWSVRNSLINQGISADRISAVGIGATLNTVPNQNDDVPYLYNRVEVIIQN